MKKNNGTTLLELIIGIGLLCVIMSLGTPQLTALRQQQDQRRVTNTLLSAVNFARSQAVTGRTPTSLCSGTDRCRNDQFWQNSLIVFYDRNSNGQIDVGESLLQQMIIPDDFVLLWVGFRSNTRISFATDGTTQSLNGTFTLCQSGKPVKQIVINATGRPRTRSPLTTARCS